MFTVQMPNHFDSIFNTAWASPHYRIFQQEWNPWGSESIARLQLMRFNLMRSCALYDDDMRRLYWNHLPYEDQLFAEAQYDYYRIQHDIVATREIEALQSLYLDSEAELLDANWKPITDKILKQRQQSSFYRDITYEDWMRGMIRLDAPYALMPPSIPAVSLYQRALLQPGRFNEPTTFLFNPAPQFYREWRNKQAYTQMNLLISSQMWAYEIAGVFNRNKLQGVAAKNRILLTNGAIPIPNRATFLAWFAACGIGAERVTPEDAKALERMCGFNPEMLFTYLIPMIPRTKEHGLGRVIGTDDSHADHSLPSRSQGHLRDEYGAIHYGVWAVRSVLLGRNGRHMVMHNDFIDAHSGNSYLYQAKQMIPWTKQYHLAGRSKLDALFNLEKLQLVTTHLMDPFQARNDPLNLLEYGVRYVDLGMRAIAKQLNIHFRFDDLELIADWCSAFEQSALWHMHANQNDINKINFEANIGFTVIPSGSTDSRKFNLDSLDGAL